LSDYSSVKSCNLLAYRTGSQLRLKAFETFGQLMKLGKTVAGRRYMHLSLMDRAEPELTGMVADAFKILGIDKEGGFNVVRIDEDASHVAFLNYPGFFEDPFPALKESWLINRLCGDVSYRTYEQSPNPPILHRKELLLRSDDPRRTEYAALTEQAESIGLFDDPKRIGYRYQWETLVAEAGYLIKGHVLVPLGNVDAGESATFGLEGEGCAPLDWEASRHRTALVRYGFSAPLQTLARHGFLDGRYRLFDYGCGRGDDVRGLRENGLTAAGWDPYYAADQPIAAADIVNLGFVINVIEDFDERFQALTRAWSLAERLLVIAVMLTNQNDPRGVRFRDGVMTQRNTFQRYYSQAEIKAYIEQALDEEPIPVAPGVLYVFRDKEAEQRFLVERYSSRCNRMRDPTARPRAPRAPLGTARTAGPRGGAFRSLSRALGAALGRLAGLGTHAGQVRGGRSGDPG
jgi:hypothetical protein